MNVDMLNVASCHKLAGVWTSSVNADFFVIRQKERIVNKQHLGYRAAGASLAPGSGSEYAMMMCVEYADIGLVRSR